MAQGRRGRVQRFSDFLRGNVLWLATLALLSFLSGFGQTYVIAVFSGEIRAEYGLSHAGWGAIYAVATTASGVVMLFAGGLADRFRVRHLGALSLLGLAVAALAGLQPVAGRMQRLGGGTLPTVVIDYAHTPDALEKVLLSLREQTPGQLVCVFGCGGNRDKGKRPLMGGVASMLADHVVVTSDNPRHEPPLDIINEILSGMGGNYVVEPDRAAAIELAIAQAKPGDMVLVAGKGHEDYQQIGDRKLPFSDAEVARRVLEDRS